MLDSAAQLGLDVLSLAQKSAELSDDDPTDMKPEEEVPSNSVILISDLASFQQGKQ